MRVKNRLSRVAAAVGAVALGAVGLLGVGAVANADPADPSYGNIAPDEKGSITIHKFLNQTGDDEGDISTGNSGFSDPVEGVVFTVYPLHKDGTKLDLTVPASWVGLSDLEPGEGCTAPTGYTLGDPAGTITTVDDGSGSLGNLGIGAYVVCETSTSGAKVDGASVTVVRRAAPFIVTLPTPWENGWIYGLHAFPKNSAFEALTKTILTQGDRLTLGDLVKFEVSIDVPTLPPGTNWTQGAITDKFDARLTAGDPAVDSVKIVRTDPAETITLTETTDYTVDTTHGAAIVFTPTGLARFNNNAHLGDTIKVVFNAKVETLGNGVIENQAGVWTNDPDFDAETSDWDDAPVTSNTVTTNWGTSLAWKHAKNTETGLAGAEFDVYPSAEPYPADGECGTTEKSGSSALYTGLVSNAEGDVAVPGLYVSDSEHQPYNSAFRCYVLKETAAPAGYVLPSNANFPLKVTIGQNDGDEGPDAQIPNTQQTVPDLPLTGAAGKLLLTVAGLGAGAVVLGLVLVNKRRTAAALK